MKKQFQGAIIVLAAAISMTVSTAVRAQSAGVWSINQLTLGYHF